MPLPLIIIPVFNARHALEACLASVARHSPDASVLLIDDASTDQEVRPLLEDWVACNANSELRCHDANRGFVATANEGLRLAGGDAVLLNSDTLVTPGWLQRLARCLHADADIATATPWTNNGEIVSFPEFCTASDMPADPDIVADLIARCGAPRYPEIPTAVGFCMGVSEAALAKVGYFDEAAFGQGYGEENDFCLRAAEAGMRNVLCDDAYVAHHGGASFAPLGLAPGEASMSKLLRKHPAYRELISDFIRRDPLAARRAELVRCVQASTSAAIEFAPVGGET